jgi:ATP-dependent DNA helicase RecG
MIVIFDANLFGLSTIHQLRGRVGRSDIQSYCILIAKESQERLKFLENCHDGFEISEYDFKNRGEGDLFGIRQSGEVGLKLANIKRDFQMLLKARDDVLEFMTTFTKEEYPLIYQELEKIDTQD